jgi:Flp pilus assembly CpaF family ATPase
LEEKAMLKHTLRLEELQLAIEELEMRLGEDNLRDIVVTGATTAHITRLGHGIPGVDAILQVGGIVLARHCVKIGEI